MGRREEQRGESLHVGCGVSGGGGGEKCAFENANTRDRVECVLSGSPLKPSAQHSVWIAGCSEGTLLISSMNMNNRVVENELCFSALRARASEERRAVAIKAGGRCCAAAFAKASVSSGSSERDNCLHPIVMSFSESPGRQGWSPRGCACLI